MSLKGNLIGALVNGPVRWVNFVHANRGVSPIVFYQLAASVHQGLVKTKVDSSIKGRTAYYDSATNTIIASSNDFGGTYSDEKALLIHESVHAILDGFYAGNNMNGKRAPMRVVDDEIMGYLAGGLYLVAANASGASKNAPERESLKIAKSKLNPRPKWDGCLTFTFTSKELIPLRTAIIGHPFYKKDWKKTAVHDGF